MSNMKLWKWDFLWSCMLSAEIVSCIICSFVFGDFRFMGIGGIALFFACLGFACALLTKRKEGEKTVLKYWKELMYAKNFEDDEEAFFPVYFAGFLIFIWLLIFLDKGWIHFG